MRVLSIVLVLWNFVRSVYSGATDPEFRRIFVAAGGLIVSGTIAGNRIEGWGVIDSFYFSVITLTTVGFGDFAPQTTLGKLFTSFYVLGGVGVIVAFINALGERRLARRRRSDKAR